MGRLIRDAEFVETLFWGTNGHPLAAVWILQCRRSNRDDQVFVGQAPASTCKHGFVVSQAFLGVLVLFYDCGCPKYRETSCSVAVIV